MQLGTPFGTRRLITKLPIFLSGISPDNDMKSFASPSFFRMFDLLLSATNPGVKSPRWTIDGVECEHERHSFTGPRYGLAMEIFTLSYPGKRGWSLMVVKEFWYGGKDHDMGRMPHWAKVTAGERTDVLAWFRKQELALEERLALETGRFRDSLGDE